MLPIIIDVGTDSCKAGFSNKKLPQLEIYKQETPSLNGFPIYPYHFVENRKVIDPDLIAPFYRYLYRELNVAPNEHPVLCAETPGTSEHFRNSIAEVLFEQLDIPAMSTAPDTLLSLYSSGITTGVVVDIGHRLTSVQAFCEGTSVPKSLITNPIGGKELTDLLERLLTEVGFFCRTISQKKLLRKIKETKAYIPMDYYEERRKFPVDYLHSRPLKEYYEMPDGSLIDVSTQRFRCTEPIFDPNLAGRTSAPLPDIINECIKACEPMYASHMWNNVVLSGGTSLLPGFIARMHKELQRFQHGAKVGLIAHEQRKYGCWIGGTVLSACTSFQSTWVLSRDYKEYGVEALKRRMWY